MTTYARPVTGGTPTTGQTVLAVHVNEPVDQIYDTILAGGITSDQIAAGAVDTSELATAAVTAAKMDGTLPDASEMATSAAPTTDKQLANKKYIDDQILSAIPLFTRVKALVKFDSAGSIEGTKFNVDSVVRNSTGVYTVTWGTNFADANYILSIATKEKDRVTRYNNEAVGTVKIETRNLSGSVSNTGCSVIVFGNQ